MSLIFAFKNLWKNPRRSFAILITVALGSGALFIYHGFNFGIMNQYKDNTIRSRYGHGSINTLNYRQKVYERPWKQWIETYPVVKKYLKSLPEVEYIFPRMTFYSMLSNGELTVAGKGQGIDAENEAKFFNALNIVEGKNLSIEKDGILLGKGLARSLGVKIGDRVTILANTTGGSLNGIDLYLVGIFHTGSKDFDDTVYRLPLAQAQSLLDTTKIESISLGLDSNDSWPIVEKKLEAKFKNLEATGFAILDKIYYQHAVDFLKSQFDNIRLIILIIVIMGIFNTVSTGILERKQEIGNLRANGESSLDVLKTIILEGLLLGLIGGALGIILAYAITFTVLKDGIYMPPSPGLTRRFHVFIELRPTYALFTLCLGPLVALVGTLLAGIRVVRMNISDLLRAV